MLPVPSPQSPCFMLQKVKTQDLCLEFGAREGVLMEKAPAKKMGNPSSSSSNPFSESRFQTSFRSREGKWEGLVL